MINSWPLETSISVMAVVLPGLTFADVAPGELPPEVGVDEDVEPAVEHGVRVADLDLGPEILAPLVGLEDVVADLAAEADLGFFVVSLGVLGLAFFFLEPDQLGLEELERQVVVLVLRPLAPGLGGDAGRDVGVAHAGFGLVLVLAAGAAAPEDVALQLVVLQLDVDVCRRSRGITSTEANDVCRLSAVPNGLIRTRRWTPVSPRR